MSFVKTVSKLFSGTLAGSLSKVSTQKRSCPSMFFARNCAAYEGSGKTTMTFLVKKIVGFLFVWVSRPFVNLQFCQSSQIVPYEKCLSK